MSLRLLDVAVAQGDAHTNTTTEGSLARHTFAANALQAGKVYMVTGSCIVSDNNGTDTLTLALRFGASSTVTSNTAVVSTAAIDSADADAAMFLCFVSVRSAGEAGVVVIHGEICQADAIAVGTTPTFGFTKVITGVDTTAALYLDLTADWSAAHADNIVAAESFLVAEVV
ncbi:MAG: hypothetical protein ACO3UW_03710 [Candidatus Nanopelagicales bacterium]